MSKLWTTVTFVIACIVGLMTMMSVDAVRALNLSTASGAKAVDQPPLPAVPLTSTFTYQGQLTSNGSPFTGNCEMAFRLYSEATDGWQIARAITTTVPVTAGLFTVGLDFGYGVFDGTGRWLNIGVKCGSDTDFTALTPRQLITAVPYALALPGLYTQPNNTSPNVVAGYGGNVMDATIVGGTIGGGGMFGMPNQVRANFATVAGGQSNGATGARATVGGGWGNAAIGENSTVGGGLTNSAQGINAVVEGGSGNHADGDYASAGGGHKNSAAGAYATVPGGNQNNAQGPYSFAAGNQAQALHDGAFVWADATALPISSTVANQFIARASGGYRLFSDANASVGCFISAGSGTINCTSDRNLKANFRTVDRLGILDRLAEIPIGTWNYKTQDAIIRHIGPAAQDFYAAFHIGENSKTISMVDAQGVSLAAIQGLYELMQEKDRQLAKLQAQVDRLQSSTCVDWPVTQPEANSIWHVLSVIAVGGSIVMWMQQRDRSGGAR